MCTVAESKKKKKKLFGWLIKIIHLPFFFSFFHASLSLSFTLISQAHSLNSGLTLLTLVTDPRSSTQAQSLNSGLTLSTPTPTHEARCQSKCLTGKPMELAADRSAYLWILVLSRCQWLYHASDRRFGLLFFFFFFSCFGLLVVVLLMVVVAMVVRKNIGDLGFFFFFFLLWTGGGGVDGGCDCGCGCI